MHMNTDLSINLLHVFQVKRSRKNTLLDALKPCFDNTKDFKQKSVGRPQFHGLKQIQIKIISWHLRK